MKDALENFWQSIRAINHYSSMNFHFSFGGFLINNQPISITRVLAPFYIFALLLSGQSIAASASDIADAAMNRNRDAVRSLLQKKVDVNAPQLDGTTALHWAVRADDLETADLLIRAGANVAAANREGVMPLQLAALNGSGAML